MLSVSFTDTSHFGQELGQGLGMVGMFGGLATANIPSDDPEGAKVKKVVQKSMAVLMKLGPVLQKLDFFSSEASVTVRDGALAVRTKRVTTYKSPVGNEGQTADAN